MQSAHSARVCTVSIASAGIYNRLSCVPAARILVDVTVSDQSCLVTSYV